MGKGGFQRKAPQSEQKWDVDGVTCCRDRSPSKMRQTSTELDAQCEVESPGVTEQRGTGEGSSRANERSAAYTGTDPINTHTRRIIGTKFVTVKER